MTSPEPSLRFRAVLEVALELPPGERHAYLASEFPEHELRREVAALLAAAEEETATFARQLQAVAEASGAVPTPSRRGRWALGAATLAFLVLAGALFALFGQLEERRAERDRTLAELERTRVVSSSLVEVFGPPVPGRSAGSDVRARELLDRGSATLRARFADQPELLAPLLEALGESYQNLGLWPEANALFTDAISCLRRTGAGDERLAEVLLHLAASQRERLDLLPARKSATAALLHAERAAGPTSRLTLRCLTELGKVETLLGELETAVVHLDRALAGARSFPEQALLAEVLEARAELMQLRGDNSEANAGFQQALQIQRLLHEPGDPRIASLESKAASVLVHTEPLRAEAELRAQLARQRELYGETHPFLVATLGDLGLALLDQGRLDESQAAFDQALAIARKIQGGRFGGTAALLMNLGNIAGTRQNPELADRYYREALEVRRREGGEKDATFALYTLYLAQLERSRGRLEESLKLTEEALANTASTIGSDNLQTLLLLANKAEIRRAQGRPAEAIELLRRAVAIGRKSSAWSSRLREVQHSLAVAEYGAGLLEEARQDFEAVVAIRGNDPSLGDWAAT